MITRVKNRWIRFYNPQAEWASYTFDVSFNQQDVTAQISLAKINIYQSDDTAAYAFIREHCGTDGDLQTCAFYESAHDAPTTKFIPGASRITFEVRVYGPMFAEANILGLIHG